MFSKEGTMKYISRAIVLAALPIALNLGGCALNKEDKALVEKAIKSADEAKASAQKAEDAASKAAAAVGQVQQAASSAAESAKRAEAAANKAADAADRAAAAATKMERIFEKGLKKR